MYQVQGTARQKVLHKIPGNIPWYSTTQSTTKRYKVQRSDATSDTFAAITHGPRLVYVRYMIDDTWYSSAATVALGVLVLVSVQLQTAVHAQIYHRRSGVHIADDRLKFLQLVGPHINRCR